MEAADPVHELDDRVDCSQEYSNGKVIRDIWRYDETLALLEAWKATKAEEGRKSGQGEWQYKVMLLLYPEGYVGKQRTLKQCKQRIENLKKKYREVFRKKRIFGDKSASWVYFDMVGSVFGAKISEEVFDVGRVENKVTSFALVCTGTDRKEEENSPRREKPVELEKIENEKDVEEEGGPSSPSKRTTTKKMTKRKSSADSGCELLSIQGTPKKQTRREEGTPAKDIMNEMVARLVADDAPSNANAKMIQTLFAVKELETKMIMKKMEMEALEQEKTIQVLQLRLELEKMKSFSK